MDTNNNLAPLSGDASFRKFYRKKNSVLVYCKKDRKKNLLIYDAINKILIKNKLKAPKLIRQSYKKNFIEIEDLGNESLYKKLRKKKNSKIKYYKKIIYLLYRLQKIKTKKTKTFVNSNYKVPLYSKQKLFDESNLFLEWYIPKVIKKKKQKKLRRKLKNIIKRLLNNLKNKNDVFVHRDFHVSNLMNYKNNIAILDNQDAVYGNSAYDLASLIDDVRLKTSRDFKKKIFEYFLKITKCKNTKIFKNDFDILSVLRNIKIIGIFTRLSVRDKKHSYLNLIPHAWQLIEHRINNNEIFKDLKFFLDHHFTKNIRIKKWKK